MALRWRGEEFKNFIRKNEEQRLEAAAIYLQNKVKEAISDPSPPVSDPGQPPHKDTGTLRASISHEIDKQTKTARVGSNSEVAKYLELGTDKMSPRPFLEPTLNANRAELKQILAGKME